MKEIKVKLPTKASPKEVWSAWRKKHRSEHGTGSFKEGYIGKASFGKKAAFFEMDKIVEGKSFCVLWKAFFVKLYFTHSVEPSNKGSTITYTAKFKGFFAPIVFWKIQKNLRVQMKDSISQFIYALENKIPFR